MSDKTTQSEKASENKNTSLSSAISKNTRILAAFAVACTLTVGLVSELTKERIKTQEQQQLLTTLNNIVDPNRYDNDITRDCVKLNAAELGSSDTQTAYLAKKSDSLVAIVVTSTAEQGYNGDIDFIMGINADGSISGVRVLKHQETPGLGDKIERRKSDWIDDFASKKLLSENDSRWAVTKDGGMFDQFTGATITPRAVVQGVKSTLQYIIKNKEKILLAPNACAVGTQPPSAEKSSEVTREKKEELVQVPEQVQTKKLMQEPTQENATNEVANDS